MESKDIPPKICFKTPPKMALDDFCRKANVVTCCACGASHLADSEAKDIPHKVCLEMPPKIVLEGFCKQATIVTCCECGAIHLADSESFVVVQGNVTVGLYGGLIGNNFNSDFSLGNISVYCRNSCFKGVLRELDKLCS